MGELMLLFIGVSMMITSVFNVTYARDDIKIWEEFVLTLEKNELTLEQIRPYKGLSKETLVGFLKSMREKASWKEWRAKPEVHRVGHHVHFLIPLTFDGYKTTYCFTFLVEQNKWYFRHLEAIFIRLDKISSFPISNFPDVPEEQKAWMREEIYWSKQVRLFNFLSKEKGRDFAFNWFRDGFGYFLGAKTWVPFVPAHKAFILYLCWEQANLRGDTVTLEKLNDNEAVVRMKLIYFKLYSRTGHLKEQISFEDYRRIFETIWQDRANHAGWNLEISYEQEDCVFHFRKK
jgi:hypothetical protein